MELFGMDMKFTSFRSSSGMVKNTPYFKDTLS